MEPENTELVEKEVVDIDAEFYDLPEEPRFDTPLTLTAETLDHMVYAWGAEYSYEGNFSAGRFNFSFVF